MRARALKSFLANPIGDHRPHIRLPRRKMFRFGPRPEGLAVDLSPSRASRAGPAPPPHHPPEGPQVPGDEVEAVGHLLAEGEAARRGRASALGRSPEPAAVLASDEGHAGASGGVDRKGHPIPGVLLEGHPGPPDGVILRADIAHHLRPPHTVEAAAAAAGRCPGGEGHHRQDQQYYRSQFISTPFTSKIRLIQILYSISSAQAKYPSDLGDQGSPILKFI